MGGQREMGKKIILAAGCLLVLGAFLLLQNGKQPSLPSAVQPVSMPTTLYHYFSGALSGGLTEMLETVNSREPGNQVIANGLDHEAFKSMILSTLEKGNPPELFTYWAGSRTAELVRQEKLQPIDDMWEAFKLSNRFPAPIIEAAVTYEGKKYLLPITQHLVVFFYNKTVFERENLSVPTTWEEFHTLCLHLKEKDIVPVALGARERWPAQFWFDYLLLRTAGTAYRARLMRGEASYTDPLVERAYTLWGELIADGFMNSDANSADWNDAVQMVCNEQAAMTLMGTWAIQLFTEGDCGLEAGKDFDFFAFPTVDPAVEKAAVGPIDGIVLTRHSVNHEFAKSVLAYFAETDSQEKMSKGSGALAPNIEVPRGFYSPFKQRLLDEIASTRFWAFNYDLATPPSVAERGMDSFNELIEFPGQVRPILQNLQSDVAPLFLNQEKQSTISR